MAIGITCDNPPHADIGTAYSHAFPATGDAPPDVFDITVGALPAGLTIAAATGVVSGTPTGPAGTSNFTVRVTDSLAATASVACSILVNAALLLIPGPIPNGYLNVHYSYTLPRSGGEGPYLYTVQSGALPPGLSLNILTGEISGVPTVRGLYNFTVRVTDGIGATSDAATAIDVKSTAQATNAGPGGGDGCC